MGIITHEQENEIPQRSWITKPTSRIEATVLTILFCATFLLGYIGYTKFYSKRDFVYTTTNVLYDTIRLFALEGNHRENIPWQLDIARYLAPTLFAYTGFKAFMTIFYEKIQHFRLNFVSNHVIICGMGDKGLQLLTDFSHDHTIVVIEKDQEFKNYERVKYSGAIFLLGNALDIQLLIKARLRKAKYIFCVTGDDETNLEITSIIRKIDLLAKDETDLTAYTHIENSQLYFSVSNFYHDLKLKNEDVKFKFFNIHEISVRILLLKYAFEKLVPINDEDEAKSNLKILIIGWHQSTEPLILQFFRIFHPPAFIQVDFTVIAEDGEAKVNNLLNKYPGIKELGKVVGENQTILSEHHLDYKSIRKFGTDSHIIFINKRSILDSISLAFSIYNYFNELSKNKPILVNLERKLEILQRSEKSSDLMIYGSTLESCNREVILNDLLDNVAKKLHEKYLSEITSKGKNIDSPATKPWNKLSESYKNANRYLADHIPVKLRAANLILKPYSTDDPTFIFTNDELEKLGIAEHKRWMAIRLLQGWTFGEKRDDKLKKHPSIIPWNDLSKAEKEKDFVFIRAIPNLLKKMGFTVKRSET